MARQALLPGYGFVNESGTRQALVPGGCLNETIAGTQTLTITPSGGTVGGGTGTLVRGGIAAISGGAVAGGAATVSSSVATQSASWSAVGGGLGGGSCVIIRGVTVAPAGGAVVGGQATVSTAPPPTGCTIYVKVGGVWR